MAKIVGVISGKGGAGKTTVAVNVAARLGPLGRGKRVLLVDADAQDAASATWYLGRGDGTGIDVASYEPEGDKTRAQRETEFVDLLRQLPTISTYDYIIVDTIPLLDSPVVEVCREIADYLVFPSRLASGDVARLVQTIQVMARGDKPYGVVLSEVDSRSQREAALAAEALTGLGARVLGTIRSYALIRRAWAVGAVAGQWEGRSAEEATADFDDVTAALLAELEPRPPTVSLSDVIGQAQPAGVAVGQAS